MVRGRDASFLLGFWFPLFWQFGRFECFSSFESFGSLKAWLLRKFWLDLSGSLFMALSAI